MFKRRHLLYASLAASTTILLDQPLRSIAQTHPQDYGVASGDPRPHSIVLWTRIPEASQTNGTLNVTYTVSKVADLSRPVFVGQTQTSVDSDFTVKVLVQNLEPFTRYYYGFRTPTGYVSVTGRTKTAPATESEPDKIKFAYVSCQDFTQGYYSVYRNLVLQDDVDFCIHLGDNIYETGSATFQTGQVRSDTIGGGEAKTLAEYRQKYQLYLTDSYWREVRRLFPWITLWDDHEFKNNYAGADLPPEEYPRQRAGYTAFLEYNPVLPVKPLTTTDPAQVQLYRSFVFGNLMEVFVLDERQYRNSPPCEKTSLTPGCKNLNSPTRTMLGSTQKQWLKDGLTHSTRRWKFLLSEVMLQQFLLKDFTNSSGLVVSRLFSQFAEKSPGLYLNLDAWDGYPAERTELLEFIRDRKLQNVVVCTGDIHNCYVGELRPDFNNLSQPSVGVEVVTGSVSSAGIAELVGGSNLTPLGRRILLPANPSMKYLDLYFHVFTKMVVTPQGITVTYEAVSTILRQRAYSFKLASFTIPNGEAKLVRNS